MILADRHNHRGSLDEPDDGDAVLWVSHGRDCVGTPRLRMKICPLASTLSG